MESMKHFASTKYNVSVITILFFFFNKYTVYCMLHWNNIRTATEYFTHLHHHTVFVCAMNICLDQRVLLTVLDEIYQISAFSQDKENVTHKVTAREKGSSVIAISSQHCLTEASVELVKRLSCWPFLISDSSWAVGALLISDWGWPDPLSPPLRPPPPLVSLPESLRAGHQRPLPCKAKGERWSREKRGLWRLLEDEHSWGRVCMQAKCASSPKLETHMA